MWLLFLRGGVMAFLGLSRFPRALHLPGELLQLPYQVLVGETECLHLVRVGLHLSLMRLREVGYPPHLAGLAS